MDLLRKAGKRINKELAELDEKQNDMAHGGTTYLVSIMNDYDLLPVQNFRFGKDDQAVAYYREEWKKLFDRRGPDGCWYGCTMACAHGVADYQLRTGPYAGQKVFVDGPEYETLGGIGTNLGIFDRPFMLELNFYCDTYGIDTISFGTSMAFVMECYEAGILDKQKTGGLDFSWGKADDVLEAAHQMARGEGFGMIVGQGIRAMKKYFAENLCVTGNSLKILGWK